MDTQPFYLRLPVLRSSPESRKHGFDGMLYSTSRCNFYEYSCITKMPSHKKNTHRLVSVMVLGGCCGCCGFAFAFMYRVFRGWGGAVLVSSEDKIETLLNGNIISKTFLNFL